MDTLNNNIVGLLPAAGYAERLNWPTAKELLPVFIDGSIQPLINKTLQNMFYVNARHIVVVTRADKPEIMKHMSNWLKNEKTPRVNVSYVCQSERKKQTKNSGFVEAIDSAYHLIKDQVVVFGMPDTYVAPLDIYTVLVSEVLHGTDVAMGLFQTNTPSKFGMVQFDALGNVLHIEEKPEYSTLKYMWGVLVWSAKFTEFFHMQVKENIFQYNEIIENAIAKDFVVRAYPFEKGTYSDFGTNEDLQTYYVK